jgi:hypothetical protein
VLKMIFRSRPGREPQPPHLADESRWYTEHTALLISTLKWALLGAVAGLCVGLGGCTAGVGTAAVESTRIRL